MSCLRGTLCPERSTDERNLHAMAKALELDEAGWRRIFTAALAFSTSDEFTRLHSAITGALDFVAANRTRTA